jgi:SAM-dependent methyltransferase
MPEQSERENRRRTFDEVAELYARARPCYPDVVIDDVVELGGFVPGARIVEIGCGTGQATAALVERGLDVTCVELGPRLAHVARRELERYPGVRVVNADFETWMPDPGAAPFDGVVAFTAFHWIDPERRYALAADLLRLDGALAVVMAHHVVVPGGDEFFLEEQDDYRAVGLAGDRPPPPPDQLGDLAAEIDASGLFGPVTVHRRVWEVTVTAAEHVALMGTASDHLLLPAEQREELFARIRRRIEARPGGTFRKGLLAVVQVARRR